MEGVLDALGDALGGDDGGDGGDGGDRYDDGRPGDDDDDDDWVTFCFDVGDGTGDYLHITECLDDGVWDDPTDGDGTGGDNECNEGMTWNENDSEC